MTGWVDRDAFAIIVSFLDWPSPKHQKLVRVVLQGENPKFQECVFSVWKQHTKFECIESECISLVYYCNGKIHRDDDQPAITTRQRYWLDKKFWYTPASDEHYHKSVWLETLGTQIWCCNGNIHRNGDLPAIVQGDDTIIQEWWKHGKRHRRGDLPAIEFRIKHFIHSEWWERGVCHRDDDKPAIVSVDQESLRTGKTFREHKWYQRGILHREGRPAVMSWEPFEQPSFQAWWHSGKLHREGRLPAVVRRHHEVEWHNQGIQHHRPFCMDGVDNLQWFVY